MKKLIFIFLILSFLPDTFYQAVAQNLPEVIALRELELNEGVNEIIFLNYYNRWCAEVAEHSKGAGGWVMKGDRGERTGEYIFAWTFNYKATRDYYFPASDWSNYPQWQAVLQQFQFHAPERPLVDSIRSFTDYVVLGFNKMIAPQLGEVIAVRYFDIDISMQKEFEEFVINTYHMAFQEHINGYYNYVLKGDRGDKVGSYVLLTVFDNADRRDEYYPVPLEPASESFNEQWLEVEDIVLKFESYLPEGIAHDYTDYIRVY